MRTYQRVRTLVIFAVQVLLVGMAIGSGRWEFWTWMSLVAGAVLFCFVVSDLRESDGG